MNSIHSTVPKDKRDKVDNKTVKIRIKQAILPAIKGKENAMLSHAIAQRIGVKQTQTNQGIRKAMKDLLLEEEIPIIACSRGFFVATRQEEIDEYMSTTEKRIMGLQRNINVLETILRKMIESQKPQQQEMF